MPTQTATKWPVRRPWLYQESAAHPGADQVQFRFTHGALPSQQEATIPREAHPAKVP